MIKAANYGIKLLISMHSDNTLSGDNLDAYGKIYGTGDFYVNSDAIKATQNRIFHILAHVNPHNGKPWSQCSEYIFAFEAQNEAFNTKVSERGRYGVTADSARSMDPMAHSMLRIMLVGSAQWPNPSSLH